MSRKDTDCSSQSYKPAAAFLLVGALVSAVGFVLAFTVAPLVLGAEVTPELVGEEMVANQLLFSQKIFYWHVPVAIVSFAALVFSAFFGVCYLMTRDDAFDTRARVSSEIALVFIVCTMATGVPWTRFEWGVWWTWEPRLTTYLIMMFLVIAYFVLRAAFANSDKLATFASVFGIIVFLDAPLCFMITRLIPSSVHPVIFRTDSGLPPNMLVPFLVCLLGMALVGFGLYKLRSRQALMADRIADLKEHLDELEG